MRKVVERCVVLVGFVTAYCLQPILVDLIKFSGGAHSSTFLILLPHYYSMALVGILPKEKPISACSKRDWKKGVLLSVLDIVNQLLKKAGLVFAGAGVYIVVESSSMVWTVFWSRLLMQKKLNFFQWFSILLISMGIALRACQLTFHIANEEFFGVILILASSILMGLTFVLFEVFISDPINPIPGPSLVFIMGICCSVVMTLWTCVWTIPNFDILVASNVRSKGGNPYHILFYYFCLTASGWLHSATLWYLVKTLGAISSGVMKGLKVALVFVISHVLFCEIQPSQCLNFWTGTSAAVCTTGVILYTITTASRSSKKDQQLQAEKYDIETNMLDERSRLIQSQDVSISNFLSEKARNQIQKINAEPHFYQNKNENHNH